MRPLIVFKRIIFSISSLLLFSILTSCFQHFYEPAVTSADNVAMNIDSANYKSRYFILRNGNEAFHMQSIVTSEDKKSITCHLDSLSKDHMLHLKGGRGKHFRYRSNSEKAVLDEVHIYVLSDSTAKVNSDYLLALNQVIKTEVLEKNKSRTTDSYVASVVGIAAGIIFSILATGFAILTSQ